jgi:hypothetical protein
VWSARIDGVDHKIELDHGIWSGRRRLVVDGWEVHDTTRLFDLGGDVKFAIAGHQGLLRIAPRSLGYVYAIALDGLWVNGGGLVTHLPSFVRFGAYAILAHALFLLAVAAVWPGDLATLVLLLGSRSVAASFVALQLVGGTKEGWFAALGYAVVTLSLGVAAALGALVGGLRLETSPLPVDLRVPIGVAGDIALGAATTALLLAPTVRHFFQPRSEVTATA